MTDDPWARDVLTRHQELFAARREYAPEVNALDLALTLAGAGTADAAELFTRSCRAADEAVPGATSSDALTRDVEAGKWARVQIEHFRTLAYGLIAYLADAAADRAGEAAVTARQRANDTHDRAVAARALADKHPGGTA